MSPDRSLPPEYTMSFADHLDELRRRVLLALALPIPVSIITFLVSDTLIRWLVLPLSKAFQANGLPTRLQALSPPETLLTKIKLSLIAAVIISAPWILWQLWLFIRPGLYHREQRYVRFLIPGSAILTLAGVALMYFVMLPLMLQVLVAIGQSLDLGVRLTDEEAAASRIVSQMESIPIRTAPPTDPVPGQAWIEHPGLDLYATISTDDGPAKTILVPAHGGSLIDQEFRISTYMSFTLILFLGIVIAFQMPLAILLLGWVGLASPEWLATNRKYAFMVCAGVSAIITPADVISMIMMLVPLYGLYELGILLLHAAPASAVAEGTVFTAWRRRSPEARPDKDAGGRTQQREAAQTDSPPPRSRTSKEFTGEETDGPEAD